MLLLLVGLFAADQNITGVVKDAAGKPVAGATVAAAVARDARTTGATTDTAGRFSFPAPRTLKQDSILGAIVAFHPNHGLIVHELSINSLADREMRFAKPSRTRVSVLAADGKPLANAAVAVTKIRKDSFEYDAPESVAKSLTAKSDASGVAVLEAVEPKQIVQLRVEAPNGATQVFSSFRKAVDWQSVRLEPTTTVKGRLDGVALPKGEELKVVSYSGAVRGSEVSTSVESKVLLGADGTFTATAVANGNWGLRVVKDSLSVKDSNKLASSAPGAPERVWTLLARTPITGVVQTKDGAPIADATVGYTNNQIGRFEFPTDANGRYSGSVLPGTWNRYARTSPVFQQENRQDDIVDVKAGEKTVELPPILMTRAATVAGVVTDENGKPAPGAAVSAYCKIAERNGWSGRIRSGQTGPDGRFEIGGVPPESTITLHAFDRARKAFSKGVAAKPGDKSATVKLDPTATALLRVTATDESGKPLDKVELRTEIRGTRDDDGFWVARLQRNLLGSVFGTGAETVSIGPVAKHLNYQVMAIAEGFTTQSSTFVAGKDLTAPIIIRLRRAVQLSGRVVDTSGKPVANVMVKPAGVYGSRSESITDTNGRFQLSGFSTPTAVVTAHKEGWRYGGAVVRNGEPATITLKRPTEPAPRTMATAFPKAAEMAEISKRISEPLAETVFGPKAPSKYWWVDAFAPMHPEKLMQCMEESHWSESDRNSGRRALANAAAAADLDEALAQIRAINDPLQKSAGFMDLLTRLPESENSKRKPLLAETLAAVRSMTDPGVQTLYMAMVGEALHDLGDPNGEKLIRESQGIANKFAREGWPSHAVGEVAQRFALFDFNAAMEMTKDLPGWKGGDELKRATDDRRFSEHRGTIARRLAAKHPANAEKAFDTMNDAQIKSRYTARICHRMAPVDLPRAKRIAAHATDPSDKAVCHADMALALGPNRTAETLPLLREAYAALTKLSNHQSYMFGNGQVALALLDVVAAVAPDDVDDFFWQALSMPGPTYIFERSSEGQKTLYGGIAMACLLAQRFDEGVAVALAVALRNETTAIFGQLGDNNSNYDGPPLALAAILATHPESASDVLVRWPAPAPEGKPQITADRARVAVPSMLRGTPAKRNERILERYLHQWVPGKEE